MDDETGARRLAPASAALLPPAPLAPSPSPVLSPPAPAPAPVASGPGDVPSPLAGRVTALNVQAGQDVKEGDHLLTLEAMKMNTFVMAPRAGKIREVEVSVGSAVDEGQALVTLE
jgi:biotin carboxyl carrier protein